MSTIDTTTRIDPANYRIEDVSEIYSPGLIVFRDLVENNLQEMIRIAGSVDRLRPHCKTHKMPGITQMQLDLGIKRHKCATIAEAEMLCDVGVKDIFLAYQLVGPNITRLLQLMDMFPRVRFATLVDDPRPLAELSTAVSRAGRAEHAASTGGSATGAGAKARQGREIEVILDLDPGMHRTGVEPGPEAIQLYEMICSSPGIRPGGLHWYDGHLRQPDLAQRTAAVDAGWEKCIGLRDDLLALDLPVPKIVACGTGSFTILAEKQEPNMQLSPGTVVLFDAGYVEEFPDLNFTPALGLLTRVVSQRRDGQITVDLGHKSVSPDKPAGRRAYFPELPDAREVHHTEEHLVLQTGRAADYSIGDALVALPRHVCPTCAIHAFADVVSDGQVVDRWKVAARDRVISV